MAELPKQEIVIIILISSAFVLLLVGAIGVFIAVYQRRLLAEQERQKETERKHHTRMTEAALDGQENERKRIAADLHDSLGSLLWGAKLNAAYLERSVRLEGESRNAFDMLLTSLDQSVESIRRIAWDLTPEAFNSVGLSESVRQLCEKLNGKGTEVVFTCTREEWMFNDKRALSAYRIIQELIVNSLKHSKARNILVSIAPEQAHVQVKVIDDGTGFELNGKRDGVGWWNIQQRATQLRAHIELTVPSQGTGSEVSLTIPLDE